MALGQEMGRLRRVPVFACLDDEALRLIAFSAESRRSEAGTVLFRRADPAEGAVLVVSGVVELDAERDDTSGPGWARAGTLLDEAALIAEGRRTATATVREAAEIVIVPRSLMLRVLDVYPRNAPALRRHWATRIDARLSAVRAAIRP